MKPEPILPCPTEPECVANDAWAGDAQAPAEGRDAPAGEGRILAALRAGTRQVSARRAGAALAGEPLTSPLRRAQVADLARACDDRPWPVHMDRPAIVRGVVRTVLLGVTWSIPVVRGFVTRADAFLHVALVATLVAILAVAALLTPNRARVEPIGPDPESHPMPAWDAMADTVAEAAKPEAETPLHARR
ncbi:MAG TPA: hypothetical protein VIJ22_15740 [Polyangiaceae bacterium]